MLTPKSLLDKKIKCLVLDFDGVLNAHAELGLHVECKAWLDSFCKSWPQDKIVILSNKPNRNRLEFFQKNFPDIDFCQKVRKKPYPDGLLKIASQKEVNPNDILLVDDRLLTGMLACCIAGTQGLLITKPYKNIRKRPVREMFFSCMRTLENFLVI